MQIYFLIEKRIVLNVEIPKNFYFYKLEKNSFITKKKKTRKI